MQKEKSGFTLLELVVVVIIIGFLVLFALPQYLRAIERAKIGKARQAIALILDAEKMYAAANYGSILYGCIQASPSEPGDSLSLWKELDQVCIDTDWQYCVSGNPTFYIVAARRLTGMWSGRFITMDNNRQDYSTHPLK